MISLENIRENLKKTGYCTNKEIDTAVLMALISGKPMLLEGAPGTGKTSLAVAIARAFDLDFVRLQMYEGLTSDSILYDYDYQRQLLTLEAVKPMLEKEYENISVQEAVTRIGQEVDFYGKEFIIPRPILKSITGEKRCVLLIDEMDKASEETEYMLYEFLENYSVTIPQYGEIKCPPDKRPIVIITSNNYRPLSGALRRRCLYLYLKPKTVDELVEILLAHATTNEKVARGVAVCIAEMGKYKLEHTPSVSEGIDWARYLSSFPTITKDILMDSAGFIMKDQKDSPQIKEIISKSSSVILSGKKEFFQSVEFSRDFMGGLNFEIS